MASDPWTQRISGSHLRTTDDRDNQDDINELSDLNNVDEPEPLMDLRISESDDDDLKDHQGRVADDSPMGNQQTKTNNDKKKHDRKEPKRADKESEYNNGDAHYRDNARERRREQDDDDDITTPEYHGQEDDILSAEFENGLRRQQGDTNQSIDDLEEIDDATTSVTIERPDSKGNKGTPFETSEKMGTPLGKKSRNNDTYVDVEVQIEDCEEEPEEGTPLMTTNMDRPKGTPSSNNGQGIPLLNSSLKDNAKKNPTKLSPPSDSVSDKTDSKLSENTSQSSKQGTPTNRKKATNSSEGFPPYNYGRDVEKGGKTEEPENGLREGFPPYDCGNVTVKGWGSAPKVDSEAKLKQPKKDQLDFNFPGPQDFKTLAAAFILTVCVLVIAGLILSLHQSSRSGQHALDNAYASLHHPQGRWTHLGGPVWLVGGQACGSRNATASCPGPCTYLVLLKGGEKEGMKEENVSRVDVMTVEITSRDQVWLWQSGDGVQIISNSSLVSPFTLGDVGGGPGVIANERMPASGTFTCSLVLQDRGYVIFSIVASSCDSKVDVAEGIYRLVL